MQILLRYPKVHSRMDNPETPLTLNTRRRTKTNSKNKQHKTNNRSNTDPIKSQGWTDVRLKGKDNPETPIPLDTRHRANTNTKTTNIKLIIGATRILYKARDEPRLIWRVRTTQRNRWHWTQDTERTQTLKQPT
jgi:hypothetical protein